MQDGRAPGSDQPHEPFADADDPVVGAVALLVLGAGLGSLFGLPVLNAVEFWVIFAIGYAVVVPLTALLRGRVADTGTDPPRDRSRDAERADSRGIDDAGADDVDAALERLRDRYARGDLSEAQFERKLEALLETETPEDARERLDGTRNSEARAGDAARERERDR
ncbi:SHOCT domain-containing protein [Halobellus ruber]|uniref:SHOCT domain-containing protein n=1 Tax=Halobellus ruber TaxID=2761102 RepID=A0A7J9SK96_9EURY|nr:SHOCT domain-containing protein [Halobellus ruber]MBB6647345.1 SHOCT domain-containing protein [Halobellus ruber]